MAKRQSLSSVNDSSYFTRLGMEVELRNLEEKAAQIRKWLGQLPGRVRKQVQALISASPDGASPSTAARGRRRRRRTMSADARRRISEAQKARWAKQKGEQAAAPDAALAGNTPTAAKVQRGHRGRRRTVAKRRGRKAKA